MTWRATSTSPYPGTASVAPRRGGGELIVARIGVLQTDPAQAAAAPRHYRDTSTAATATSSTAASAQSGSHTQRAHMACEDGGGTAATAATTATANAATANAATTV